MSSQDPSDFGNSLAPDREMSNRVSPEEVADCVALICSLPSNLPLRDASEEEQGRIAHACDIIIGLLDSLHDASKVLDEAFFVSLDAIFTSGFVRAVFTLRNAIRQMIPESPSGHASVCTMADQVLSSLLSVLCQQSSKQQEGEDRFDESLLRLSSVLDSMLSIESSLSEQTYAIALLFCCLDQPMSSQGLAKLHQFIMHVNLDDLPAITQAHVVVLYAASLHQGADLRPHVATVLLDAIIGLLRKSESTAVEVLLDHSAAVIPFLLQSSCRFPDHAEALASLVFRWLRTAFQLSCSPGLSIGSLHPCIRTLVGQTGALSAVFEIMLLKLCTTIELQTWLLLILCAVAATSEDHQLDSRMLELLLPQAATFLSNEHCGPLFLRYLSCLSRKSLQGLPESLDVNKVLKLIAVQVETDSIEDRLEECLTYLIILAVSRPDLAQGLASDACLCASLQALISRLILSPTDTKLFAAVTMLLAVLHPPKLLVKHIADLSNWLFMHGSTSHRALYATTYPALLIEHLPNAIPLLAIQLLQDATECVSIKDHLEDQPLPSVLQGLICLLEHSDSLVARFVLTTPTAQYSLRKIVGALPVGSLSTWFTQKLKAILLSTKLSAGAQKTVLSPVGHLYCGMYEGVDGQELKIYREIPM